MNDFKLYLINELVNEFSEFKEVQLTLYNLVNNILLKLADSERPYHPDAFLDNN